MSDVVHLDELMNVNQLVEYLRDKRGVDTRKTTLNKARWIGRNSPPFRKLGRRVVYVRSEVDAWLLERLSPAFPSTSAARDHEVPGVREAASVAVAPVVPMTVNASAFNPVPDPPPAPTPRHWR